MCVDKAKVSFLAFTIPRIEKFLLCILIGKNLSEVVDCVLRDIYKRDKIMNFMKPFLVISLYIS